MLKTAQVHFWIHVVLAYLLLNRNNIILGHMFATQSVRLDYRSSSAGKMMIDRRTAVNLELISNARSGSQKESLFGIINHTKSSVGAALLRKTILNPSTDIATIQTRLDVTEIFLKSNRIYAEVAELISKFPDFEKVSSIYQLK